MQHYFNKNKVTYDRKNGSLATNNSKCLCVLLSIIAFLIAVLAIKLWIIYGTFVKVSEHDTKRMTSQPLHTETSSGKHRYVWVTPAKINRLPTLFFIAWLRLDSFSETHMQTSNTTPLLATTSLYKNASGNCRLIDIIIQYGYKIEYVIG